MRGRSTSHQDPNLPLVCKAVDSEVGLQRAKQAEPVPLGVQRVRWVYVLCQMTDMLMR